MTTPPAPAVMLTVEEAAALLRIGRTRAFALIGSGELRSKKLGRSRLVPHEAVIEFARSLPDQPPQ